jgi:DNA-binding CsgD family transcriptional regulator
VLERAVGFDGYCVNLTDPETFAVTSSVGDGLDTAHARRLFALERDGGDFNQLRELAAGTCSVASLSESTSGRVERSRRMREIFLPLGYADELRAALRVDGRCWGYLHLFRARGRDFGARDVDAVSRLTRPLAAALRDGVKLSLLGKRTEFEPAVLVVAARGQSGEEGDMARVQRELDDVTGATVPHVLHEFATRPNATSPSATGIGRSGAALGFRSVAVGQRAALLVDGARTGAFERLLYAAARLSPREREVAHALAGGASNEELARALSIRLYTAKDHVRAVFAKLGVASRLELVAARRA